jgi:nucleoside-diphosphate-sugar epimerase
MRVFVTGATGFIGSAVVKNLLEEGHKVIGFTRSQEGAKRLTAAGATPHWGRLEDLDSLRSGAASADAVIHLAFIHGFSDAKLSARLGVMAGALTGRNLVSNFLGVMMRTDLAAIETLGSTLVNSNRPLIITVGTMGLRSGLIAAEQDAADPASAGAARSVPSEKAAAVFALKGVRTSVVRLPPSVHGDGDAGFIPRLIAMARKKRASAYVGDGGNRWPAAHRLDVARLYRLILEKGTAGSTYHGVAEIGIPFREIAEVIGRGLKLPAVSIDQQKAAGHFSWFAPFVTADNPVSSQSTQKQLGWQPTESTLIRDIDQPGYFARSGGTK